MSDLIHQVEAILFSIGKKVDVEYIRKLCRVKDITLVSEALEELKKNYDSTESSLQVVQEGELWKLTVREKYSNLVRKIVPETEMTKTVMETLAVIAWKQPIIQSDVIKIRTNKAYDHIKQLQELGFVTSQKFGRTKKLKLTQKFLDYFDLKGIDDIKELFKQMREKETAENPPETGKGAEVARLVEGIRQAVEDQTLVSNAIENKDAETDLVTDLATDAVEGKSEEHSADQDSDSDSKTFDNLEKYDTSDSESPDSNSDASTGSANENEEKETSDEVQEFSTDKESESAKEINQMMSEDLAEERHKHSDNPDNAVDSGNSDDISEFDDSDNLDVSSVDSDDSVDTNKIDSSSGNNDESKKFSDNFDSEMNKADNDIDNHNDNTDSSEDNLSSDTVDMPDVTDTVDSVDSVDSEYNHSNEAELKDTNDSDLEDDELKDDKVKLSDLDLNSTDDSPENEAEREEL